MTAAYKPLGAINPAATTNTALYTVPGGTQAIGSSLVVTNQGTTQAKIRVAHRPLGAALAAAHYIAYDQLLQPAGSNQNQYVLTGGLAFQATDVVTVYSDTANVSFVLEGVENP